MENFKRKAVRELLLESLNHDCSSYEELASVEKVYKSVEQDFLSAWDRYDMSHRDTISDREWCQMMFRDDCFIIYFITSTGKMSWLKKRNRDLVWRDIILLENQFPLQVLSVLEYTSFGFSSYLNFMSMLINGEEDVKELRAREVIQLNLKFSNEQVVNFFKDIVAHHDPNPQGF
ncbi:hypothetical protein RDI58_010342 [Solanum bulbocastanum]|uniref:Uncharacterized protein n=1 Tax=Solanum bulbocastanum TaxID=147425 RepID=A0AAN8YGP2_SOLBU